MPQPFDRNVQGVHRAVYESLLALVSVVMASAGLVGRQPRDEGGHSGLVHRSGGASSMINQEIFRTGEWAFDFKQAHLVAVTPLKIGSQ